MEVGRNGGGGGGGGGGGILKHSSQSICSYPPSPIRESSRLPAVDQSPACSLNADWTRDGVVVPSGQHEHYDVDDRSRIADQIQEVNHKMKTIRKLKVYV